MHENVRAHLLRSNAGAYARVALANIQREYPVAVPYVITGPGPLPAPRELHPAFYGSFDWHSCVEMHWVLVRLLRRFGDLEIAADARRVLDRHLSVANLATEAAYFDGHRTFERPYGWGWALMLARELAGTDDARLEAWSRNIAPLASRLRDAFCEWLPRSTYPLRTGLHGNSAFGLLLALPYARAEARDGRPSLLDAIADAAMRWYARDAMYPAELEPSGSDFLSPALTEAALMRELLSERDFVAWFDRFLPELPATLLDPAVVTDTADGQIAHLHGLNLSRAFCMRRICEALADDESRSQLGSAIDRHASASLGFVVGSEYTLEHWLAAYAMLLLS